MLILGWLFFSFAAGLFASVRCNRSGIGWFFVAIFFTPLVAFVLLAILRPLDERVPIDIMLADAANDEAPPPSRGVLIAVGVGVALLLTVAFVRAGESQQVFRDSSGRTLGTATQSGNQTTFRDASGRTAGTATTDSAGNTVLRDAGGRSTGSISSPRGR